MKRIPSAIERYKNETERLFSVLNKKLEDSLYISGEYSRIFYCRYGMLPMDTKISFSRIAA
jgi:hypothetical protein